MTLPPGAGLPGMEVLTTGIAMGESPRWHDGRLHLSDWMAGELLAVDADGTREVVARVPSLPFCVDWHPDGTLLVVFGSEGRVMRVATDGTATPYADLTPHSRHPWNEIVTDWFGASVKLCMSSTPAPGSKSCVSPP